MYISIDRNSRGILDIEQYAINKLIQYTVAGSLAKEVEDITVSSELYHDTLIYILVKITLPKTMTKIEIDEKYINKALEEIIFQTLNIKPKNIAIAYSR